MCCREERYVCVGLCLVACTAALLTRYILFFSPTMTKVMKPHMCALVLLFTVHLLHAEDLTTTLLVNTTDAYNNSSNGNVTCGENQEYCEDTQSCSQKNHQCNGCRFKQVKCPDGRCRWDMFHTLFGCSKCILPFYYECPSGYCLYDSILTAEICPGCRYSQTTCPDGLCAEHGQNCTSCPEGQKRCANKDCIPKSKKCPEPCFYGQVYCKDEKACHYKYQNCKCRPSHTPTYDGSCVYNKLPYDYTDDETYDYTSNDSGWSKYYTLIGILTGGFVVPCCVGMCIEKQRRKYDRRFENMQAVELQPVSTSSSTTRPVFQNTPSHFPVPVSVRKAVPQPHARRIPTIDTSVPNIDTPLMETSAPSIQTSLLVEPLAPSIPNTPPPSYEQATNLPPSYNDVVTETTV